jgi:hypothetical protein
LSQNPPGQQPQQPQYPQGYPQQPYPQGQFPQQYPAPYSPYQMPQVHPMMYAQAQMQGASWKFSRAGMMLMITGGLMGLCGIGCAAMGLMPMDQVLANAQLDPQMAAMMTPELLKAIFFGLGAGGVLYAVLAIILGIMVRRGSKGATITAIVITSLVVAYLVINFLAGLFQISKLGPQGAMGECIIVVPLAVCVWQLVWLISAVKSGPSLAAAQGQMQMQYWQMMQMQQQQYQQMMAAQQQGQGQQNSEVRSPKPEERPGGGDAGPGQPPQQA